MKWLLTTFVLLVVLLIAAYVWLVTTDFGYLKPAIENYVHELTGRELRVAGNLRATLDDDLKIFARNITFANPDWASADKMLRIDRLMIVIDSGSIFIGPIIVKRIEISGAQLYLEELEDGPNNWSFGISENKGASEKLPIVFEQAQLEDAKITIHLPQLVYPLRIAISSLKQVHELDDDSLSTVLAATINDRPVMIDADIVRFESLIQGEDINYNFKGSFGTFEIASSGYIDDLFEPSLPDLVITIDSDDVEAVAEMFGLREYGQGDIKLAARLTPNAKGIDLSIKGRLAELHIEAAGQASELSQLQEAEFDIDMRGPRINRLLAFIGIDSVPDAPFSLSGSVKRSPSRLEIDDIAVDFGDARLRMNGSILGFPDLDAANIKFNLTGPELEMFAELLQLPDTISGPFELDASIQQDSTGIDIVNVRLKMPHVSLTLAGPLGEPPNYSDTDFDVTAFGADLHTVMSRFIGGTGLELIPNEPFTAQGTIGIEPKAFSIGNMRFEVGAASISGSARIASDRGSFSIDAAIPDIAAMRLPETSWRADALPFEVRARGSWRDDRWTIDIGHLEMGETTVEWSGVFDRLPDLSATNLKLDVYTPSIAQIGTFDGERLPDLPFALNAHFDGTAEVFEMDEMLGELGGTKFRGKLDVALDGARPVVNARLELDVLDVREWYDESESTDADPNTVIPDITIPLEELGVIDGNLEAKVQALHFDNISFTDGLLKAQLVDRSLRISELDVVAPQGRFDGTLTVTPDGANADVHWTVGGKNLKFNVGGRSEDLAATMAWDVAIDLKGRGATTRELAGSLNGQINLLSENGGNINNQELNLIFTSFGKELMSTLNPFSKEDRHTRITCAKFALNVRDGVLETNPNFVLQTRNINLMSKGSIDLATEQIDLNFSSKPRKRLSISAGELINPYVRLVGTLSEPKITVNRQGTMIAALTAGWSIVAQAAWDRTFRAKNPCRADNST